MAKRIRITSIMNPNRTAHNSDMLSYFGREGDHWPDAGMPERIIQGVRVWVTPIVRRDDGRKSSKHRVMAACPDCGAVMSAGRLHQHVCEPVKDSLPLRLNDVDMREALSRPIMIHICRDGTISYRDSSKREPVFNGVALPVFSVDTVEEAKSIQHRFGRLQYVQHPINGMDWYKLSRLEDGTDPASRPEGALEVDDLEGVTRMFDKFWRWDSSSRWPSLNGHLTSKLARAFCEELKKELNGEFEELKKRTAAALDANPVVTTCLSHDYCDANMVMDAAFTRVVGRQLVHSSEDDMRLFNEAWTMAKRACFSVSKVTG